jgi:ribosomal protein S18 acetylase RimI-like enzyme
MDIQTAVSGSTQDGFLEDGQSSALTHPRDPTAFTLRILSEADEEFSFTVYASTRIAEMELVNWPDEQKNAFLRMQFNAQHQHYRLHYPQALWQVIEVAGQAAGRLVSDDADARLFLLMDIALLPEYRGRGIGTAILRSLLQAAGRACKTVSLHVEPNNPALRLYQRLGFEIYAQSGFYLEMKRAYA